MDSKFRSIVSFIVFVFAFVANPVSAQLCFNGAPKPDCTSFIITEAGAQGFIPTGNSRLAGASMVVSLGWMLNISPRRAIGVTFNLEPAPRKSGPSLFFSTIGVRYRHWHNKDVSVDAVLSIFGISNPNDRYLSARVIMTHKSLIGIEFGVAYNSYRTNNEYDRAFQLVKEGEIRTIVAPMVAIRAGSYYGLTATLLSVLALSVGGG